MKKDNNENNGDISKNDLRLGGNIWLIGFNDIDKVELAVVKKIVGSSIKKMAEKTPYDEVRIRMKKHDKGKSFLHEISSDIYVGGLHLNAKSENRNIYSAISTALNNLLREIEHKFKK